MSKARKIRNDSEAMSKLLQSKGLAINELKTGEMIEGLVVSVSHREILVDVGAKSEGIISGAELMDADNTHKSLKPGDKVLAKVIQAENDQGYIVLSLKRAEKERKWTDADDAFKDGSVIEAVVIEYNKGGLLCDCLGLRGFIPLSHLDRVHFANDMAKSATGSETELKESLKVLSGNTLKVKADDTLEGIVTGIMPFGVFVDLEGVEGLVHISEIAWEKVSHPSHYFKVGETIKVLVLGVDEDTKKLALSVKRLTPNPWETVEEKYPVGAKIKGKVNKIVPFGAFVTIEKGLDGLIHVSETVRPLKEGEEVEAIVTQVDGENQKLALSMRTGEEKDAS